MRRGSLCFLALVGAPAQALAQTSTPIDRDRVDRAAPPAPAAPAERLQAPTGAISIEADTEAAPPIRNIAFEGTDVPLIVAKAAETFVGRPANRANLQALTDAMSKAYERSEVALFTIAIPEQDLSSGKVRILVAEGHLEAVLLTGEVEGRELKLVKRYADRMTHERPTSRRILERYLSLIQDIPGLKVKSQLQMGHAAGGVRLILDLDYQRPTLSFAFDNRTTRLVDDGQVHATARAYQLLREGDDTQLNATASVNFKDMLFAGASHSTPIGFEGTRLALNGGVLKTRPKGTDMSGEARSAGVLLSHPLIRSYRRNLTLSAALDGVNSRNAAFGSLIASEKSRAVRAAVSFVQTSTRRTVTAGLTASKGLDILGARVPADIGKASFLKVNGRATLDQALGKRGVLRLRASGQWTRDPLPAVERFAVGGPDFGRAFETGLINADRGIAGLAELAWRPIRSDSFSGSELYGFTDAAFTRVLGRPGAVGQNFDLASAGGGIRAAWKDKVLIELEYARTLDDPYPGYDSDFRLSIGWRLNLRP
jgi:hemolysin activation/secretion protein